MSGFLPLSPPRTGASPSAQPLYSTTTPKLVEITEEVQQVYRQNSKAHHSHDPSSEAVNSEDPETRTAFDFQASSAFDSLSDQNPNYDEILKTLPQSAEPEIRIARACCLIRKAYIAEDVSEKKDLCEQLLKEIKPGEIEPLLIRKFGDKNLTSINHRRNLHLKLQEIYEFLTSISFPVHQHQNYLHQKAIYRLELEKIDQEIATDYFVNYLDQLTQQKQEMPRDDYIDMLLNEYNEALTWDTKSGLVPKFNFLLAWKNAIVEINSPIDATLLNKIQEIHLKIEEIESAILYHLQQQLRQEYIQLQYLKAEKPWIHDFKLNFLKYLQLIPYWNRSTCLQSKLHFLKRCQLIFHEMQTHFPNETTSFDDYAILMPQCEEQIAEFQAKLSNPPRTDSLDFQTPDHDTAEAIPYGTIYLYSQAFDQNSFLVWESLVTGTPDCNHVIASLNLPSAKSEVVLVYVLCLLNINKSENDPNQKRYNLKIIDDQIKRLQLNFDETAFGNYDQIIHTKTLFQRLSHILSFHSDKEKKIWCISHLTSIDKILIQYHFIQSLEGLKKELQQGLIGIDEFAAHLLLRYEEAFHWDLETEFTSKLIFLRMWKRELVELITQFPGLKQVQAIQARIPQINQKIEAIERAIIPKLQLSLELVQQKLDNRKLTKAELTQLTSDVLITYVFPLDEDKATFSEAKLTFLTQFQTLLQELQNRHIATSQSYQDLTKKLQECERQLSLKAEKDQPSIKPSAASLSPPPVASLDPKSAPAQPVTKASDPQEATKRPVTPRIVYSQYFSKNQVIAFLAVAALAGLAWHMRSSWPLLRSRLMARILS